MQWRFRMINVA